MMAWLPIFFMYFSQVIPLNQVLILEALYYISVVVLEIPSGYFSDVIGRRTTLIISSLSFTISYLIFGFIDPTFISLLVAQIFLACGMSFLSGTDTSFYYETLKELNLTDQYVNYAAKVESQKQIASAVAVLSGGLAGYFHLNWAYILSFIFVIPTLFLTFKFKEPLASDKANQKLQFFSQIKALGNELKQRELRWLLMFSLFLFILAHIPYEFYQPYLQLLETNDLSFGFNAAIFSGIIFAITRLIGGYAAHKSPAWLNRYGLKKLCFIALGLQLIIISLMGFILHIGIVLIVLLRSFSMSLVAAPINAEIAPRVKESNRASYFSFQSLLSRLSYSLTLVFLSFIAGSNTNNWSSLSTILIVTSIIGVLFFVPLIMIKAGNLFNTNSRF
ncbi:MAG: MFS transporter [Bacteroidia bacterium]|nr:MFS transporter [Bacteroidia bacterium]